VASSGAAASAVAWAAAGLETLGRMAVLRVNLESLELERQHLNDKVQIKCLHLMQK